MLPQVKFEFLVYVMCHLRLFTADFDTQVGPSL